MSNRSGSTTRGAGQAGHWGRSLGRFAAGVGMAMAVAALVAWLDHRWAWARTRDGVARELVAVGELKLEAMEWWQWERVSDGLHIQEVAPAEALLPAALGERKDAGRLMAGWMGSFCGPGRYLSARLLDREGRVRLAVPDAEGEVTEEERGMAREALAGRTSLLRDLAWSGADEGPPVSMAVPLGVAGGGDPQAVMILRCGAPEFMERLLSLWPSAALKGRTLLGRVGEAQVVVSEGGRCVRLDVKDLPGSGTGVRWTGPGGESVLAARLAIPGLGWELVTQVSEAAVAEPLGRRRWGVGLGAMAWVLALEAGWVLRRRRRDMAELAEEVASQREEQAEIERRGMLNRGLVEHLPQRIYIRDRESRYLACNGNQARALGADPDRVVGCTDAAFLAPEAAERAREEDARVLEEGRLRESEEWVATERGSRCVRTAKVPYRNAAGEVVGVLGIAEDVTERRAMEDALRASEAKHRAMFEQMQVGFALHEVLCDPTGRPVNYRYLDVNPAFERVTGVRAAAVLGRTVLDVFPGVEPEWIARLGEVALSGRADRFEGYMAPLKRHFEVQAFCPRPGQFGCTFLDITARRQAEEAVRGSLAEKESLLREVHHRVKNNLQIVNSLLHLQSAQLADGPAVAAFRGMEDRVRSMALLHETLYRSGNLARADAASYLESLCSQLVRSFAMEPGRIEVVRSVAPMELELDLALPCGLIVTELVSNALRHAFPEGRKGRVSVGLQRTADGLIEVRVGDDGVGYPRGLDPARTPTLGLQLVHGLAAQLRGTMHLEPGDPSGVGAACRIVFPGTATGAAGAGARNVTGQGGGR